MHEVKIRDEIWNDLKSAAEKHQRRPETLANQALKDFLRRMADEELLDRSIAAARRAPLRSSEAVQAVREFRRKK
jgi:predicted transcriptional regulator